MQPGPAAGNHEKLVDVVSAARAGVWVKALIGGRYPGADMTVHLQSGQEVGTTWQEKRFLASQTPFGMT